MDRKELEDLIRLVEDSDVQELHVRSLLSSVRIVKTTSPPPPAGPVPAAAASAAAPTAAPVDRTVAPDDDQEEKPSTDADLVPIVSPMVGTLYHASSPESPPYVKQGDHISKGQVVCIVEAMKLMNEIESEVSGRVVRIVAENGKPVEFGETLFLVQPD